MIHADSFGGFDRLATVRFHGDGDKRGRLDRPKRTPNPLWLFKTRSAQI